MRIALAAAALVALAACGQRSGGDLRNELGKRESGLPMPGERPGNGSADLGSDQAFRQSYRTINIATCVNAAQRRVQSGQIAPGADFRAYCTCSVDRLMAGLSVEQLTSLQPGAREDGIADQCAREHGLIYSPAAAGAGETGDQAGPGDGGGK